MKFKDVQGPDLFVTTTSQALKIKEKIQDLWKPSINVKSPCMGSS